jgi:hypothetical protein
MVGVLALLIGAAAGRVSNPFDTTPETPENAVMNFLTAAQVGRDEAADNRLCSRLGKPGHAEELATIDRVEKAGVFGEGLKRQHDASATVMLRVVFPPSPPGAVGEPWEAHMVKEHGRWKVCGFVPAEAP